MQIELNGVNITTDALTLEALMIEYGFSANAVATTVNGAFIPRDARRTTLLSEGIKIEVLSPMQGG